MRKQILYLLAACFSLSSCSMGNKSAEKSVEKNSENMEQKKDDAKCFIENLDRFTLYSEKEDKYNEGAVYHYDCGRKLDILLFMNQNRMDARLVDENNRKKVLNLDFGDIGLDMSDPEVRIPYVDNEYLIGQYDFDGDKADELIIAVKSNNEADMGGICLNIWRIDDMRQWILPASSILGEPACEFILNKIKIPRNLHGFYYEWTFQNNTFEDTGCY